VLAVASRTTTPPEIRFNKPSLEGLELEYMRDAVEGGHTSASGPFSARTGAIIQQETGAHEVLLTTSCTAALELAAMLLDLQPGDTVIVPSFTFTASALAFAREGARILFCDIEPDTFGLDPTHVAELLDDSVRAVVPVHYAGVACDMAGLHDVLSGRQDVDLIEDNAHGLFGRWQGRALGSLGRFATLSFHETKNFVCGEGGALLVNHAEDSDRARVLYDKGTNRKAFFLGQVDKYSWKDTGSSFGMSDTLAAYLFAQLEQRDTILSKRRRVFNQYVELLAPQADRFGLRLPIVPADREQAYHMFHLLLPDRGSRDGVLDRMRAEGVHPTFHYVPLHSSDGGRRFSARQVDCPVTDDVSGRLIRLPFYNSLSEADVERVVSTFIRAVSATA
jgi:dTDP-4-amino-4,6-dideoxygalactose transaminase